MSVSSRWVGLLSPLLWIALIVGPVVGREPSTIAKQLQPFVDDGTLAGAVTLVANQDGILALDTVGYADVAAGKPMQGDALFWIASMSKPITGVALMMLVDKGKVNLDDPVEKYLPEFKNIKVLVKPAEGEKRAEGEVVLRKPAKPVTVRNIMNHTSGLDHFSPLETPTLDRWPLEARVRSYPLSPLLFEPESAYKYSNQGINTGGRIVEVVSGMPFEKFLEVRLFALLGMRDTTFVPSEAQAKRIATSYKAGESGKLEPVQIQYLSYPLTDPARGAMPGGGLFSTAADLALLCRMVLNDGELAGMRYLSPEAVREMTKLQTPATMTPYGIGWSVAKEPARGFGHGGAYATNMWIDPEKKLVMIFLVQYAGGKTDRWSKVLPTFKRAADETFGK